MAKQQEKAASKIIEIDNLPLDNSNPAEEKVIQNPDIKSADYQPKSQICSTVDTVAPLQLLYEMNKSVGALDRKVRGIDQYVMEKLGYTSLIELCQNLSAEQVDAVAMAIYNIEEKHQAIIVGDMTGVGKGRVAAAIMRYARLQGHTPIFFTEKPNLFSDIYRDIIATGSDSGVVQDYLTGEREKEVKVTTKEIREKIEEDIENGDFDLVYDADKLFKKGYETETLNCIEEYREMYFPTTVRTVPVYKRNNDYEKEFKASKKKFVPFIVNAKSPRTNIQDVNGNYLYKSIDNAAKNNIYKSGDLPKEYDCILLTYSQIRNPGKAKDKIEWLEKMATGNIVIMDESHNASGSSNTGKYLQSLLQKTMGATFLSATFAKRPDNMPIYAQKTAISDAGLSNDALVSAIMDGGVALQEILSADLVSEGQMLRREKSYEGVDVNYIYLNEALEDPDNPFYNPKFNMKEQHRAIADNVTSIIRNILLFQRDYVNPAIEGLDKQFAEEQERVFQGEPIQEAGINNPPIFNGIFNLINQLLLSIKAKAVAEWAIMRLNQGKKPVIALANTMESFLDYMIESGEGEDSRHIKTDFSVVLKRRLLGTLRYTRRYPDGTTEQESLDVSRMSGGFQTEYYAVLDQIEKASIGINVSPIDVILTEIEKAGFSIAEVTGRNKYVEFTGKDSGIIKNRMRPNNSDLFRKFNDNEIDCLLINQSGATGASAHAIKTKKANIVRYDENHKPIIPTSLSNQAEVKQRVMIVLQAELNVNTEVQKRGRINRTGQVFLPIYDYIISPIPAEMRLMMMLQKKLKSLDANTTSNQKQSSKVIDVVDFLNAYGNDVIVEYMKTNPAVNELTGNILKFENNQPTDDTWNVEDRAHRVSGRVAILSTEMQEDFYETMINDYNSFVQKKKDAGEYNLEVERIDLRAETVNTTVMQPPNLEGKRSVFSEGVYLEEAKCQNLRKPYTANEVEKMIDNALMLTYEDGNSVKMTPKSMMEYHLEKFNNHISAQQRQAMEDADLIRKRDLDQITKSRAYEKLEDEKAKKAFVAEATEKIEKDYQDRVERYNHSYNNIKTNITTNMNFFFIKRKIDYPLGEFEETGDRVDGICLGLNINYRAKNPFAPSAIEVSFILANSLKRVKFKLTDGFLNNIKEATRRFSNLDMTSSIYQTDTLLERWDDLTKESRSDRVTKWIVTGNLLKALGDYELRQGSKLITFTTHDNRLRKGLMLPDAFKPKAFEVQVPILKALPIIKNMSDGEQMYLRPLSETSITKSRGYWILMASGKGSGNMHKDLQIAKYAVFDQWERKQGIWSLKFEEHNLQDAIEYLSEAYKLSLNISGNKFDAWKDRLGYGEAIEKEMEKADTDGAQEILKKYNQEYEDYERRMDSEMEPVEEIDQDDMTEVKRERDIQTIRLKLTKLYFMVKKNQEAKKVDMFHKGGSVSALSDEEKRKLRYYLKKEKSGIATDKETRALVDYVDMIKNKISFSPELSRQINHFLKKHNLTKMKNFEYKLLGDLLLTDLEFAVI